MLSHKIKDTLTRVFKTCHAKTAQAIINSPNFEKLSTYANYKKLPLIRCSAQVNKL